MYYLQAQSNPRAQLSNAEMSFLTIFVEFNQYLNCTGLTRRTVDGSCFETDHIIFKLNFMTVQYFKQNSTVTVILTRGAFYGFFSYALVWNSMYLIVS